MVLDPRHAAGVGKVKVIKMEKCIQIHKDENIELDLIRGEGYFVLMTNFVGVHGPEMAVSRAISPAQLREIAGRLERLADEQAPPLQLVK